MVIPSRICRFIRTIVDFTIISENYIICAINRDIVISIATDYNAIFSSSSNNITIAFRRLNRFNGTCTSSHTIRLFLQISLGIFFNSSVDNVSTNIVTEIRHGRACRILIQNVAFVAESNHTLCNIYFI